MFQRLLCDFLTPQIFLFFFHLFGSLSCYYFLSPRTDRSSAAFYAMCQDPKNLFLSSAEKDSIWKKVPEKKKKKIMEEYNKIRSEYGVLLEKFLRVIFHS